MIAIQVSSNICTKCGKCVRVCPVKIFEQNKLSKQIEVVDKESCIVCGHCVAACKDSAVQHNKFPDSKVHPVDRSLLPSPEQMLMLCQARRSNRAFSNKAIPMEQLDMIIEAAHRAPTGSNAQEVQFTLVTDPEKLRLITDISMEYFEGILKKLQSPILKPFLKWLIPDAMKYIPSFEKMKQERVQDGDPILRKATAVLLIHTPKASRLGSEDANLAYQNGSLMAECLGISQFYTGFVLVASKQDKKQKLAKSLGINGVIQAGMALALPRFQYPKYIDRKDLVVQKI